MEMAFSAFKVATAIAGAADTRDDEFYAVACPNRKCDVAAKTL
jgi:hypothetical protein